MKPTWQFSYAIVAQRSEILVEMHIQNNSCILFQTMNQSLQYSLSNNEPKSAVKQNILDDKYLIIHLHKYFKQVFEKVFLSYFSNANNDSEHIPCLRRYNITNCII